MSMTFAAPPELKAALTAGFDPDKVPWETIVSLIRWALSLLLSGQDVTPAVLKAAHPDCPEECCEHLCNIMKNSLTIFTDAAECCHKCKPAA